MQLCFQGFSHGSPSRKTSLWPLWQSGIIQETVLTSKMKKRALLDPPHLLLRMGCMELAWVASPSNSHRKPLLVASTTPMLPPIGGCDCHHGSQKWRHFIGVLVALYRAIRLRVGYGFESRDANGLRNVKTANLAKQRLAFSPTSPCW